MSDGTSTFIPTPTRSGRRIDWGALSGVVFALAMVATAPFDDSPDPTKKDAPDKWQAWLADSGNAETALWVAQVSVLAIAFFYFFLHRLYLALAPRDGEAAGDGDRGLRLLMVASGVLFGGMLVAATALGTAPALNEEFSSGYSADPNAALMATAASVLLFTLGAMPAAVMLWTAALLGSRTGALPKWLVWPAYVVGVLLFGTFLLFGGPVILLVLWILVVSVRWLWLGRRG